jgi:hypothetical protein
MVASVSFLEEYTSTLPKEDKNIDEEDESKSIETKQEDKKPTVFEPEKETTDSKNFLSSYVSFPEEKQITQPVATKTDETVKSSGMEPSSAVGKAQTELDRLLSSVKQEALVAQKNIVSDLQTAAPALKQDTEEYRQLAAETQSYLGKSLEELSGKPGPAETFGQVTAGFQPAVSTEPSTKFLDTYIAQSSSSISTEAQSALSGLLGKPVTPTPQAKTIVDTFKENLGNAQARTLASVQQAGTSYSSTSQTPYTNTVNISAQNNSYAAPKQTLSAVTPSTFASPASNTSISPVKSTPQSPDISRLSQTAQANLEKATGVTQQKQVIDKATTFADTTLKSYSSDLAENSVNPNSVKTVSKEIGTVLSSLPKEQQTQAGQSFLDNFLSSLSDLGGRIQSADTNLRVATGEPASFFLNYLAGNKQTVTEENVSLDFLRGLESLLQSPENKTKLEQLKNPGDAVTVNLSSSTGIQQLATMSLGESAVVYRDPKTGSLKITDTKDSSGSSTIKDGKWTGKLGVYMFDRDSDGGYKIDAAGLPGAPALLKALDDLGIPRGEFPININFSKDKPEDLVEKLINGFSKFTQDGLEKLLNAAQNNVENAKEALDNILNQLGVDNPWDKDPDLSGKEWFQKHDFSGGKGDYLSSEEADKLFDWSYGTHSMDSIKKAVEKFPWWTDGAEMLKTGKRPTYTFSLPVSHHFSKAENRAKILVKGVLRDGPVWFSQYLTRNPLLQGIKAGTSKDFEKERLLKAAQKTASDLFQKALNALKDVKGKINWNDVMRDAARARQY